MINWLFVSFVYRVGSNVGLGGSGDHIVPEGQKVDDSRGCAEGYEDAVGMCQDCSVYHIIVILSLNCITWPEGIA